MARAARRALAERAPARARATNPAPAWPPSEDLAFLGRALDVSYTGGDGTTRELAWRGAGLPALAWAPGSRVLYVFPMPGRPAGDVPDGDAARAHRRFHAREPAGVVELPTRRVELRELGDAVATGYRSRKWHGRPRSYHHEHGPGVRVWRGGFVVALAGGRLAVTSRGIEH